MILFHSSREECIDWSLAPNLVALGHRRTFGPLLCSPELDSDFSPSPTFTFLAPHCSSA